MGGCRLEKQSRLACIIFLVSAAETIGDTSAMVSGGLNREITGEEIQGSLACDGYSSAMSSLFGCPPLTSFSQNVGLVANGLGISVISKAAACSPGSDQKLLVFDLPVVADSRSLYLVYHKNYILKPYVHHFMEFVLHFYKKSAL